VATSDEEAGGAYGIDWLAAHRPDVLVAEYALNEGGRIRIVDGRPLYVAIQTAEKVPHLVRLTARGAGGHAAVPLPGNAITRLGRALAAVGRHREPLCLLPTTRRFFRDLSVIWPQRRVGRAMAALVSADDAQAARGARTLSRTPLFDAVLRNGVSPTRLEAGGGEGSATNVIPTRATATLDVRTLPGQSVDDVVERLRAAIDDPQVEIEVVSGGRDAPTSDFASPMFEAIAESARTLDPRLAVVPYLSTGATDSAVLRRLGVQAFGLLPFPLTEDDERRMHGHDERIPIESLRFGVRLVYDIIVRMTTRSSEHA
jgi:acetylornithine deacetylase/succinyl-diaminopimelate desuccinylase-like protein